MNTVARVQHEVAEDPTQFISTSATDRAAVDYLNQLFRDAARKGASDVHIEIRKDGGMVRLRIQGELETVATARLQDAREYNNKIRMKCKLALIEHQSSLDGKFRFDVDGRFVDVRVSILPLPDGQSIVCRLLDQSKSLKKLSELSMPDYVRQGINHIIQQPQGLFLVTGPTGSGKTTTLYGVLQQLNTPKVKIITIEDPIEFEINGIVQACLTPKMSFAGALKSMLRQDPDAILVGEIRDTETARIAVQAALTGHIVLSTLHTNSATLTLNRLIDLGVDPNSLSAAMGGFMAQRLVRSLCPHCRRQVPINAAHVNMIVSTGIEAEHVANFAHLYEVNPHGCAECIEGWKGREPIFELILPTPEAQIAIDTVNFKGFAQAANSQTQYTTLKQSAMLLVLQGITTLQEAIAVTGSSNTNTEASIHEE